MRTSRFTEEQIRYAVQQAEAGLPVPELCRKYGVAPATFYRWRQTYGALTKSELARLKELAREHARLKKLVAELTLDGSARAVVTPARRGTARALPQGHAPGPVLACSRVSIREWVFTVPVTVRYQLRLAGLRGSQRECGVPTIGYGLTAPGSAEARPPGVLATGGDERPRRWERGTARCGTRGRCLRTQGPFVGSGPPG